MMWALALLIVGCLGAGAALGVVVAEPVIRRRAEQRAERAIADNRRWLDGQRQYVEERRAELADRIRAADARAATAEQRAEAAEAVAANAERRRRNAAATAERRRRKLERGPVAEPTPGPE